MKYITTNKHPELKEEVIIKENNDQYEFKLGHKTFFAGEPCIDSWLSKGYIKEVEEKEFTKFDLEEFLVYYFNADVNSELLKAVNYSFNTWLKNR